MALTSEEGARFPISMVASGVWAAEISLERAHNLKEVGNGDRTIKQELERIGYLGQMNASYEAMPLGVQLITVLCVLKLMSTGPLRVTYW